MKIFLTSMVAVILCFGVYTLLADYQIKGSFSTTTVSSTGNDTLHVVSRIGESISGSSGNSSINVNSGVRSFDQVARATGAIENTLSTETQAVDNETLQSIPTEYKLYENYPNPFNPSTTIRFDIPEATTVSIDIYDIRGQRVAAVLNGKHVEPGSYEMNFDASRLSTGIYLYRITAGSYRSVKKMMLMK